MTGRDDHEKAGLKKILFFKYPATSCNLDLHNVKKKKYFPASFLNSTPDL